MRWSVLLAVVTVVVTAGCGFAGPTAGTETITPAPVPQPATPVQSTSFPPGVTTAGIVSVTALARAHRASLADRSFRRVLVVTRSTGARWERQRQIVHAHNWTVYHVREVHTTDRNRTERVVYADGEQRYVRCQPETRCPAGAVDPGEAHATGTILGLLSGTESRVDGTVRRDGDVRYRIVTSGTPTAIGSPYGVVEVSNYTATALVAPSGRVVAANASYELLRNGQRTQVTVGLRYTEFGGARVTPPPWYRNNGTEG